MNTQEIANKLVSFMREGQYEAAQRELYAENAVSIEPEAAEGQPQMMAPRTEGLENIVAKGQQWQQGIVEVHSTEISEPIIAGNHFSITSNVDLTFKEMGRQQIQEISVYKVLDGKVVEEQHIY